MKVAVIDKGDRVIAKQQELINIIITFSLQQETHLDSKKYKKCKEY